VMITVSVVLVVVGMASIKPLVRSLAAFRYAPKWIDLPIALAIGQAIKNCFIEWRFSWVEGPVFFDAANYHVPRALMWSWHGNMEPYQTPVWQMLGHPFGGSASLLSTVFYGCGWLGGGVSSEVLSLGAAAAVALLSMSFGFSGRASLLGALVFISFPPIGLRLSDVNTDIAGTFPVIAAAALFRTAGSLKESVFLFVALTGLGAACKQYAGLVAAPIGLMLAIPHMRKIVTDWRILAAGLGGAAVAAFFFVISLRPIYLAFGDLSGGGTAVGLTNFAIGLGATYSALMYYILTTIFDPFSFLPAEWDLFGSHFTRKGLFEALHVHDIFVFFGHSTFGDFLELSQERNKTGVLSILFLPWLLLGLKKGTRLSALAIFVVVCLFQYAPLATNHVGARFAILPLAAFALLWAGRANTRPVVVSVLLIAALLCDRMYLSKRGWGSSYVPELEQNRDLSPIVQNDPVLLVPYSLSQDALVAGKLGQVRFEYIVCPADDNWVKALSDYKQHYKWFMFSLKEPRTVPGPTFKTVLGPPCKAITLDELRNWLTAAGWKQKQILNRSNHELWTTN